MSVLLLTGSTGFIGSWILEMLEESDIANDLGYDTLRLLVRNPVKAEGIKSKKYKMQIKEGNLLDHESLANAAEGVDAVIHSAAVYDTRSSKKTFNLANVEGTKALIESLQPGTRFVLTSTYGVYGFPNREEPLTEEFEPKRPVWHYQKSKKLQEELAKKLCAKRDIRFCAIRPPTTIGPREYLTVPIMIRAILEGQMMLIDGGNNIIPFAHGADAARAHLLALKRIDEIDGNAFHFESFHVSFKEFVSAFCRNLGLPPVERSVPLFMAMTIALFSDAVRKIGIDLPYTRFTIRFISSHTLVDRKKIKSTLGYEPEYDLERTVRECVSWFKKADPKGR
jgi:nucleoside-diphosphate-sugar epimerase